jgi:hypothetical protein
LVAETVPLVVATPIETVMKPERVPVVAFEVPDEVFHVYRETVNELTPAFGVIVTPQYVLLDAAVS